MEMDSSPIILSHHPLCGSFSDHYFSIRGRYFCKGCMTVYPTALVTLVVLLLFNLIAFEFLFYSSLILFILNCYRFIIPRSEIVGLAMNAMLGVSLGSVILSLFYAPDSVRLPWTVFVFITVSVFVFLKGLRVFNVCRQCPRYGSFPKCGK